MSMIYGSNLRLRAIERDDVRSFYQWVNDPDVARGLSLYLPLSMGDEEKWFDGQQERDLPERPLAIEISKGDGWKLVGNCGVFAIEWVNSSAELGIMIGDKSVWDQGIGTQVMTLLLRHCFETLNLHRAFLRVHGENMRARRAYRKAGFVDEGCMRQAVYKNGKYDDLYVMSVLRSEWDARKVEG
jgi:RimJ/RimL family protein N-acetyltransferase